MSEPSIVYVTAGTHGAGHMVRGAALGRALAATGVPHRYTLLAPPGPYTSLGDPWWAPMTVDAAVVLNPKLAPGSDVARAVAAARPDLLVIDVFWAPLRFIALQAPAWLLLRSVPPPWLVGPPHARFNPARYERILAIEPAPGLERFEPWPAIVCPPLPGASPTRAALCQHLGVDPADRLLLRAQAGLPEDEALLVTEAESLWGHAGLSVTLEEQPALFPLGPWLATLRDDDELVAGAGYNLFWEVRANGVAAQVHWVPLPRRIDSQADRIRFGAAPHATDGAQRLAAALLASVTCRAPNRGYS